MVCSFFGVQLVVAPGSSDPFQTEIGQIIKYSPVDQTVADKRVMYTRLSGVLHRILPLTVYGYWDLIRDPAKAQEEFDSWCGEVEGAGAAEPSQAFGTFGPSNQGGHSIVTVAFLVQQGSNSDHTLGARCDLPEGEYWTKATFTRLLATFPLLNFTTVVGDAIYVVPGPGGKGPTAQELQGEGYEYLQRLQ